MSNLSQFYGGNNDSIELELWVVGGGGGGGGKGPVGSPGGGGGGGIYYNHVTVPRGSTMTFIIGAGGAGGAYDSATNMAYSGYQGGRSYVNIYKSNFFAKTYTAAGGGSGGFGGYYNSPGGDGGCGGGAGKGGGYPNTLDAGLTYSAYKTNYFFAPPGTSNNFIPTGRSYYTLKNSYWSQPQQAKSIISQSNGLKTGYYGSDAATTFQSMGGGVFMPIPGLLNVTTPGYYSTEALWGWDYDPHDEIPIVSIPGGESGIYSQFLGYANTGNGGNGGSYIISGNPGSSGFIFFRYSVTFGEATYSDSDIRDVTYSNIYNYASGYRAYIVTGVATLTLPSS